MIDASIPDHKIEIKEDYLPFLDGFRGLAALWVVAFHSSLLMGAGIPVIKEGLVPVEVFMVMSGFLMAYHYYVRQGKEPWEHPLTWGKFYIRRFFRIAPLYYFLFIVYLASGPLLGSLRHGITQTYSSAATDVSRYSDNSWSNILWHISFLFGLSPEYSFHSPMPDWSIGLEMEFYLVFPFLMLLFRGKYFFINAAGILVFCKLINKFLVKQAFTMPSFLTLSLDLFLIGMLLALLNKNKHDRQKAALAAGTAIFLAYFSHDKIIILVTVLIILLLNQKIAEGPLKWVYAGLSNRMTAWLADMSYCAYLVHLLFMVPIAAFFCHQHSFIILPGPARCALLFITTVVPTYATAMLLFNTIEKKGILWGKSIVKRV